MRGAHVIFGLLLVLTPGLAAAEARDGIYIPLLTYRTGPFATTGTAIANGMHDYLSMLNERDGGIAGVRLDVGECETGYDTGKGVDCYETAKAANAVIVNPASTGTALQLIPRASVDKIPILCLTYGLSAAAVGQDFPWVFNPPVTSWDGLSTIFKYVGAREGGLDRLRGKTIGFVFMEGGYGREPIPLLEEFARDYGFTLKMYPINLEDMQSQTAQWQAVRRDRPAWMVMWGWGAMNPAAVQQAARVGYPMDHLVSVWWGGGEDDVRPAGAAAKGYTALNFTATGGDFPALREIRKYVVDKGLSQVESPARVGEAHYNKGVFNAVLIAEAIRNAQKLTGRRMVTGEDVRRGLEALDIGEARWSDLGLPGFGAALKVTCADHNGHGATYVQQWNGTRWVKASDWVAPMTGRVQRLLEAAARDYVSKDPAWPARTEPCDGT